MTSELKIITDSKFDELLAAARQAKQHTDDAYELAKTHPKGDGGLSPENVEWLMGFQRWEHDAYAELGRYVFRQLAQKDQS